MARGPEAVSGARTLRSVLCSFFCSVSVHTLLCPAVAILLSDLPSRRERVYAVSQHGPKGGGSSGVRARAFGHELLPRPGRACRLADPRMKVIVAGLPLTGEGSLAAALAVLGLGSDEVVDCTGFDFLLAQHAASEELDYVALAAAYPQAKVRGLPSVESIKSQLTRPRPGYHWLAIARGLVAIVPVPPGHPSEQQVQDSNTVAATCTCPQSSSASKAKADTPAPPSDAPLPPAHPRAGRRSRRSSVRPTRTRMGQRSPHAS